MYFVCVYTVIFYNDLVVTAADISIGLTSEHYRMHPLLVFHCQNLASGMPHAVDCFFVYKPIKLFL